MIAETIPDSFPDNFIELKEAIFAKRPVLREIIQKHGKKSLYDYGQDYLDVNTNKIVEARKSEFLGTFHEEVRRTLGSEIANGAVEQLKKYYFVNTSDHHGPICHPFFVNANNIIASSFHDHTDQSLKYVIVLSCANVSLNNSSFPRGLIFTGSQNGKTETHRLSFLPSNSHAATVFNFRSYTPSEITKLYNLIKEKAHSGAITSQVADKLRVIIDDVYATDAQYGLPSFSDQMTVSNYHLWQHFSHEDKTYPNLIYVEQESLVIRLLLEHHFSSDSAIHHILFDPAYAPLIEKYFNGIMGAFNRVEGWGTYFFWGVSEDKNYRIHLWREGNRLVSGDGKFSLDLTPEAIKQSLEERKIIPSALLIFVTLSLYYGVKCLGGVNQVNYLTQMKQAFIEMQQEMKDTQSVEACEAVQTKEFVDGPTIVFLETPGGTVIPATGLDLILYGDKSTPEKIVSLAKNISLEEAFDPLLPEYYPVMYAEKDRQPHLSALTTGQITSYTNLDKKIQACARLVM